MAKSLIVAGLLAAAGFIASTTANAAQLRSIRNAAEVQPQATAAPVGTWTDLFSAPYTAAPGIIMAISCQNPTACYVPGGSNGVGFQILKFDGQPGGSFTPMNMPNGPLMLMAMDVRGPVSKPGGAAGGMGIGNGLQYIANTTTWLPSTVPAFLDVTQDIRASSDGKRVLAVDAGGTSDVWYSVDGGKNFTTYNLNVPFVTSGTFLRYASIPAAKVWYLTAGNWPNNNNNNDDVGNAFDSNNRIQRGDQTLRFVQSYRVAVTKDATTGKTKREVRKIHKARMNKPPTPAATASGYSAQIFKTEDGGKTFKSVFATATNYYFNAIDCVDVNTCYAVAEGFDSNPGVHIFATKNGGSTWSEVYFLASTSTASYSLMSIGVSQGIIIAAGGSEGEVSSQSLIITSPDGVYWTQQTPLANIVDIADLDVIPGGYAFAAAMTVYDDSTILAYRPKGAPTLPPAPTQATFSQIDCSDAKCSVGCTTNTFAQNSCLQMNGGGSALVSCTSTQLVQQVFSSSDCSGNYTSQAEPLNQCLAASGGGYFENQCSGASL